MGQCLGHPERIWQGHVLEERGIDGLVSVLVQTSVRSSFSQLLLCSKAERRIFQVGGFTGGFFLISQVRMEGLRPV